MEAMEKGALGYVTKAADDSELLLAIEEVSRGKVYIQQSVVRGITVTANLLAGLTKKEKLIFDLIKKNYSNLQIAEIMKISLRTTENYVSKIYDKLGVNDRNQLVVM